MIETRLVAVDIRGKESFAAAIAAKKESRREKYTLHILCRVVCVCVCARPVCNVCTLVPRVRG